jgi:hypothetical protein
VVGEGVRPAGALDIAVDSDAAGASPPGHGQA